MSKAWAVVRRYALRAALYLIAAGLFAAEVAMPFYADRWPPGVFAALSAVVAIAATGARVAVSERLRTVFAKLFRGKS